jgi:hypothetical protein
MTTVNMAFADFERIYPTENDIAFGNYNGVNGSEVNFSNSLNWRRKRNCILPNLDGSGFPTNLGGFAVSLDTGLNVRVAKEGRAFISGRYIQTLAGTYYTVPVDATKDTYLYLQLNVSGTVQVSPPAKLVTVTSVINAIHARPANSVLLAKITTNATDVLAIYDQRPSSFDEGAVKFESPFVLPHFAPGVAFATNHFNGTRPTANQGYSFLGYFNFGEFEKTKSICFDVPRLHIQDSYPDDYCATKVAICGANGVSYNEILYPSNANMANSWVGGNGNDGFLRACGSISDADSIAPIKYQMNIYAVYYATAVSDGASFYGNAEHPPTNIRMKEWNAVR